MPFPETRLAWPALGSCLALAFAPVGMGMLLAACAASAPASPAAGAPAPGEAGAPAPGPRRGPAEAPPELPLAWNASTARLPILARDGRGAMVPTGEALAPGAPVPVSEERLSDGRAIFRALRARPDRYIEEAPLALAQPAAVLPRGVSPGEIWLELGSAGTLTTFEGRRPLRASWLPPEQARALRACAASALLRPSSPCLRRESILASR